MTEPPILTQLLGIALVVAITALAGLWCERYWGDK